jgi:hypothetical protein
MKTTTNTAADLSTFTAAIEAAKTLAIGARSAEANRIADEMNAAGVPAAHPLRAAVHEVYFAEFFAA